MNFQKIMNKILFYIKIWEKLIYKNKINNCFAEDKGGIKWNIIYTQWEKMPF